MPPMTSPTSVPVAKTTSKSDAPVREALVVPEAFVVVSEWVCHCRPH